jgi:hypothetical protein
VELSLGAVVRILQSQGETQSPMDPTPQGSDLLKVAHLVSRPRKGSHLKPLVSNRVSLEGSGF